MFLCREKELAILNGRYNSQKFECAIIYGRRRVGKTSIINEFVKDKPCIYFSALNATAKENLQEFSKAIYNFQQPESEISVSYASFADALENITRLAEKQQLVLVIDEYPYLAKAEGAISSRLQHIIDHKWSKLSLFVILCGSSMSFMERQVLGYESPLYGRRTCQLKIEPLTYLETARFNPQLSPEENALVYGITGGVPHYINKLAAGDNLGAALLENVFNTAAYLFEEPGNLLKQELREPAVYNTIISVIANGASRLSEIAEKSGMDSASCTRYINALLELGIVAKETPAAEPVAKKTIYFIKDMFFRFWYRFIPQNYAAVNQGRMQKIFAQAVLAKLHEYMGLVFEEMCREYLLRYAENVPVLLADARRWWGTDNRTRKQVEIDIVGMPVTGGKEYLIGSCKFRKEKVGVAELELLQNYARVFGRGERYHYYIFSLGGFTSGLEQLAEQGEVVLISLADLYA